MFEDSLLDSGGRGRTRKPATVAISLVMQSVAVGILILIPLVYTEALPQYVLTRLFMAPPAPPPPAPVAPPRVRVAPRLARQPQPMVQPKLIPRDVAILDEKPLPIAPSIGYVGAGENIAAVAPESLLVQPVVEPPPPAPEVERTLVGGDVMAARLTYRPSPAYPEIARRARVQGTVLLQAIISKDGTIENLTVLSGHPLLVRAALDAVQQWRYQPTLLNGVPVEVETTVEVNFKLGG